jgi:hypothetical protein
MVNTGFVKGDKRCSRLFIIIAVTFDLNACIVAVQKRSSLDDLFFDGFVKSHHPAHGRARKSMGCMATR